MNGYRVVCAYQGRLALGIPEEWLENFDVNNSFGVVNGAVAIRFPNGKAFMAMIECDGPMVRKLIRELDQIEISEIAWGPMQFPWEPYIVSRTFGHGRVIALDQVAKPEVSEWMQYL